MTLHRTVVIPRLSKIAYMLATSKTNKITTKQIIIIIVPCMNIEFFVVCKGVFFFHNKIKKKKIKCTAVHIKLQNHNLSVRFCKTAPILEIAIKNKNCAKPHKAN